MGIILTILFIAIAAIIIFACVKASDSNKPEPPKPEPPKPEPEPEPLEPLDDEDEEDDDNLYQDIILRFRQELQNLQSAITNAKAELADVQAKAAAIEDEAQAAVEAAHARIDVAQSQAKDVEEHLNALKKAERIAYNERVQRDATMNHNRLIITGHQFKELKELYDAIERLHLINPTPFYKAIYTTYLAGPVSELVNRLGVEGITGIYKITNVTNQKCYVGQAVNVGSRWSQHIKRGTKFEDGTVSGGGLYDAMFEEGVWNFSFEVLEECERDELTEREHFWIDHYSCVETGYNKKK